MYVLQNKHTHQGAIVVSHSRYQCTFVCVCHLMMSHHATATATMHDTGAGVTMVEAAAHAQAYAR